MSNLELLDRAAGATTCQILSASGSALVGVGAIGLVGGGVGFVPFSAGALSLLAANYLCPDMPMGGQDQSYRSGCQLTPEGGFPVGYTPDGKEGGIGFSYYQWTELVEVEVEDDPTNPERVNARITARNLDGTVSGTSPPVQNYEKGITFGMRPAPGNDCGGRDDGTLPLPPDAGDTYIYNDPVTNCTYNVTLQGFAEPFPGGPTQPVFLIEASSESGGGEALRSGGGRMGGCNFPPVIYMPGGGGKPPVYFPVPTPEPDGPDGLPWWAIPLMTAIGGALLNQILDAINGLFPPMLDPSSFTLIAPCDVDEAGNKQTRSWQFGQASLMGRMLQHQVAMMEIMQQHLDWKTPICGGHEKPVLEGTWISTRWISDGNSPGGERPLRKLFRYRSKSLLTDEQLREYWADFTWEAGDFCITHKGAWWGNPQVWAATEEEGKRVIRFAAAEAGIDPDQIGEWLVGRSRSPRYGMSGTMRLEAPNGIRWVTRRDGPSSVPQ